MAPNSLISSFNYKPSVYLSSDISRENFDLWVTLQLPAGQTATSELVYDGEFLKGVTYTVVLAPEEAPREIWTLQQKVSFSTGGEEVETPWFEVIVQEPDGSRNRVIVHHADSDLPGGGGRIG